MSKLIIRIPAPAAGHAFHFRLWIVIPLLLLVFAGQGLSKEPEDFKGLRRQLAAQEELLPKQGELLKTQLDEQKRPMEQIENLKKRLSELEQSKFALIPSPAPPAAGNQAPGLVKTRDNVGDLNADAPAAGSFPGSFEIPGSRNVSLVMGGFVKTVAIADSSAKGLGSNMLPSRLGTQHVDNGGSSPLTPLLRMLFSMRGRRPRSVYCARTSNMTSMPITTTL